MTEFDGPSRLWAGPRDVEQSAGSLKEDNCLQQDSDTRRVQEWHGVEVDPHRLGTSRGGDRQLVLELAGCRDVDIALNVKDAIPVQFCHANIESVHGPSPFSGHHKDTTTAAVGDSTAASILGWHTLPAVGPETSDLIAGTSARDLLGALPRAVIVTDPNGVIVYWNAEAERLYGWSQAEVVGRPVVEVLALPGEHAENLANLQRVVGGASWEGDRVVARRDGEALRIYSVARPVYSEAGVVIAVVGVSGDVTDRRLEEDATKELGEHLRLALDAGQLGTWRWDMTTGFTSWDAQLESIYGLEPGGFDGTFEMYVATLHPDDRDRVLDLVNAAVAARSRYRFEHRILLPDGVVRWVACAGEVTVDDEGSPMGTIGCVSDITERVSREHELAREIRETAEAVERERLQRERLEFLTVINDSLNEASTVGEIMRNVARVSVPRLGDWCSVYVLTPGTGRPEVEIAHVEPEMVTYARQLQERFPYDATAGVGVPNVIRTARSEFYPNIDSAVLDELEATAEERAIIEQLALRSAITVPLTKRGRVLGAIQFVMSNSSRTYTVDDLALAELVGVRIAASIENRRLIETHREVARTLQAGLLADSLPAVPGIDVAVGYWPAGEGAEVGGDFYDVFEIDDEQWAFVVGDVCGTGPEAASVTGLARHSVRDAAWHGDTPREVLRSLNRALFRSQFNTFCTAVYATVRSHGGRCELVTASGGHPLPIYVPAGSTARQLGDPGTLLGMFAETTSTPVAVELNPGDVVVFYTDGATDLPAPHGLTAEEFRVIVSEAAGGSGTAEGIAEHVHDCLNSRLAFGQRDDDLALLVLCVQS